MGLISSCSFVFIFIRYIVKILIGELQHDADNNICLNKLLNRKNFILDTCKHLSFCIIYQDVSFNLHSILKGIVAF